MMIKITISDQSSDPVEVVITGPNEKVGRVFDAVQEALREMEEEGNVDAILSDCPEYNSRGLLDGAYRISMGNSKIIFKDAAHIQSTPRKMKDGDVSYDIEAVREAENKRAFFEERRQRPDKQ